MIVERIGLRGLGGRLVKSEVGYRVSKAHMGRKRASPYECRRCGKPFVLNDMVVSRGGSRSYGHVKYYHVSCFERLFL